MRWKLLGGWLVLLIGSAAARSDVILSFTPNGTATTFTVPLGGTVNVPVYLVERNQAPLTNILSTEGLFSGGIRLNYNNTPGSATVIANGAVLNPGFNTNTNGFPIIDNAAGFAAVSGATTNPAGVPASGNPAFVLVGTFTFQGNQVGNVTTISTAKPQALAFPEFLSNTTGTILELQPYGNIFFAAGNPNNPISYSTTLTTVSSVPESTTYLLLALGTIVLLMGTYRSRNRTEGATARIVEQPASVLAYA